MHPLRLRSETPLPNYQSSASLKRRFGKDTRCLNARVSSLHGNRRNIKGITKASLQNAPASSETIAGDEQPGKSAEYIWEGVAWQGMKDDHGDNEH